MRSGTDLMPQNGLKVQLNSGHPTRLTDLINTHPFSSQTSRHQRKQIGLFGASIARSPARPTSANSGKPPSISECFRSPVPIANPFSQTLIPPRSPPIKQRLTDNLVLSHRISSLFQSVPSFCTRSCPIATNPILKRTSANSKPESRRSKNPPKTKFTVSARDGLNGNRRINPKSRELIQKMS